ncbi:BCCT family transporter [Stomatohabitans albus]|uniref:BCCT family transporter n=1 Tax=Stomatohabitans albus TaxID=3110766 RepID=UPI00300C46DC
MSDPDSATQYQTAQAVRRIALPAAAIITAFVAVALIAPEWLGSILSTANSTVVQSIGWYYALIVVGFIVVCAIVVFSAYGNITLGDDDDEPEYSLHSWFAMLFAAGMGIGLVFWGVAEPLNHLASPPPGLGELTIHERAQEAMNTTFLHWGFSAWGIYAVIGLAMAYAIHRLGRSVSIRWVLEPLLGERINGRVGDVIDIVAIVGTMFGVATSLGLGATQLSAGLEYLGLIEQSTWFLVTLVVVISLAAGISVASGLDVGIKWLSNGNMVLAAVLAILVLLLGQPGFVLREFVQSIGEYIQNFIHLSFRTMPFRGDEGSAWMAAWTTNYWGWWMSWSPFVGIFIARISRGRTVREFVIGVLAVPTLVTFLWFSILGGTALYQQIYGVSTLISADGTVSTSAALFQMLEPIAGGRILSGLFLLLLVVFFVTSSDSASFVVGMLSSGGDPLPDLKIRLLWATASGTIAAVLLWGGSLKGDITGGLATLQTMSILAAAPFSLILVGSCFATLKVFHEEYRRDKRVQRAILRRELKTHVRDVVETQLQDIVQTHVEEEH